MRRCSEGQLKAMQGLNETKCRVFTEYGPLEKGATAAKATRRREVHVQIEPVGGLQQQYTQRFTTAMTSGFS
jgi:hypothetical protein